MTKEALKLALDALEEAADAIDSWGSYASEYFQVKHDLENDISKAKSAITAIKAALEAKDEIDWKDMYEKQKRRSEMWVAKYERDIGPLEKAVPHQEAKDEPWEQFYPEMGKPYAFAASIYSNDRMKVDPVTGNVSIGTVTKACGLECDCTDVCKQDDYKALWQQMCERCDELDKKLAQLEAKDEPAPFNDPAEYDDYDAAVRRNERKT